MITQYRYDYPDSTYHLLVVSREYVDIRLFDADKSGDNYKHAAYYAVKNAKIDWDHGEQWMKENNTGIKIDLVPDETKKYFDRVMKLLVFM